MLTYTMGSLRRGRNRRDKMTKTMVVDPLKRLYNVSWGKRGIGGVAPRIFHEFTQQTLLSQRSLLRPFLPEMLVLQRLLLKKDTKKKNSGC